MTGSLSPRWQLRALNVGIGFCSEKGQRPDNQDFAAALVPQNPDRAVIAAVADGVGGHKGGREAAELTVRALLDGCASFPETLGVRRAAARALEAINAWIHAQGGTDPNLKHMACTLSAVALQRRSCHIFHIGDSRIYRLSEGRLTQLTTDHVARHGEFSNMLQRGIGLEHALRLDYASFHPRQHDRLLICTDGVHGVLKDDVLRDLLDARHSPQATAQEIVTRALAALGSQDNATALVVDILDLPPVSGDELVTAVSDLPILDLPRPGEAVDGFQLGEVLSDGHYSRLFKASDPGKRTDLVIKFPHPRVAAEKSYRLAFVREAWVAARMRSQWIGEVIEVPAARQSRLYSVMPFYEGQTLEQRIKASGGVSLSEGLMLATRLARAVTALHRAGIIHRDIKPENVILTLNEGLRLIDLGVSRVPEMEDFPQADIPGTPSYMAPELFAGQAGDELSDQFALGVTVFRLFTGTYPYGEIEPFTRPRFNAPTRLSKLRPDLPAWLEATIERAIDRAPQKRFGDTIEFIHELENAAASAKARQPAALPLYERNPLLVWKLISAALFLILLTTLVWHH